jgi:hypothetical protein
MKCFLFQEPEKHETVVRNTEDKGIGAMKKLKPM